MVLACIGSVQSLQVLQQEALTLSTTKVTKVTKRIVLFHTTGPFKGIARIAGLLEGTAQQVADALRPSIHYKEGGKAKEMQHWKTLPRAIWYREWALESAGRLNDFHGQQV